MRLLFIHFLLALAMLVAHRSQCQEAAALDSLRLTLEAAKTPEEKVFWWERYALAVMNVDRERSDSLGRALIEYAEETRNRRLMVQAYMASGQRLSFFTGNIERQRKSAEYYQQALEIAGKSKLDDMRAGILVRLSLVYAGMHDKEKALSHANQAASVVSTLKNDSLSAEVQLSLGNVYQLRNEKILALRFFLNALRISEKMHNYSLMRSSYSYLSRFYAQIDDYEKAIDYATEAYHALDHIPEKNVPYQRVIDVSSIGNLYSLKKSYDIAINHFHRAIAMADSLHFTNLKLPAYMNLFNQFLRRDQPAEALAFFNSEKGEYMKEQLRLFGMASVIDQAYGITYTALGRYDSAKYFLVRATPFFEKNTSVLNQMYFYHNKGILYKKMGYIDSAIHYFEKLKRTGENAGVLENIQAASKELDSLYAAKGDLKTARTYYSTYILYRDSIEVLGKEKELAQEEAADEQQRQERLDEERAEQARRRNNIQYLSITFGIFGLFLLLVVLGMFRVSANLIRGLGFFAFLLFFEFIFLIFKKNIHSITHGEPWKDLAFMIALAAMLVPLHHYLEKKVLNYLTSHDRLKRATSGIRQRIFRRSGSQES
jgi:tetratricopeptide (TPR) repeat protein